MDSPPSTGSTRLPSRSSSTAAARVERLGAFHPRPCCQQYSQYHNFLFASGPQSLSRYEFTTLLVKTLDLDHTLLSPITTAELGQDAPRPRDSSIDAARLYDAIDDEFRPPSETFEEL